MHVGCFCNFLKRRRCDHPSILSFLLGDHTAAEGYKASQFLGLLEDWAAGLTVPSGLPRGQLCCSPGLGWQTVPPKDEGGRSDPVMADSGRELRSRPPKCIFPPQDMMCSEVTLPGAFGLKWAALCANLMITKVIVPLGSESLVSRSYFLHISHRWVMWPLRAEMQWRGDQGWHLGRCQPLEGASNLNW